MRPYRIQEPPFSVTPELTLGCNLYCDFCAIKSIRTKENKDFKFMSLETMDNLMFQVKKLGWNSRIEFAMCGEPTLNPNCAELIQIADNHRPKSHKMMISNGGGLLKGEGPMANILRLFESGLNVLAIDDYLHSDIAGKIRQEINKETGKANGFKVFDYPLEKEANPHQRRPRGTRMVVFIEDVAKSTGNGNHGKLFNSGGYGFPKNNKMEGKRCHHPFRQLAVRWNGDVNVCCNDWRGAYYCGNINLDGVEAVWQGRAMGAAREMLIEGRRRALEPCNGCDWRSYRVGLLPDLLGAGVLHKPDAQTEEDVRQAMTHPPFTTTVKLPWED